MKGFRNLFCAVMSSLSRSGSTSWPSRSAHFITSFTTNIINPIVQSFTGSKVA